jgi:organic radical activating enzyme
MIQYQVNELFTSIQGEGMLAGRAATFVRLQGCTVGCEWCDTKYTWARGGVKMSLDEILTNIQASLVVITGGEPTLYDLDPLIRTLRERGIASQIETSGQNALKGEELPNYLTWSPKARLNYQAPKSIKKAAFEVKWVVDDDLTLQTVWAMWNEMKSLNPLVQFVLMPEGTPPSKEHAERALKWLKDVPTIYQPFWRFGDRLQYRIGVR